MTVELSTPILGVKLDEVIAGTGTSSNQGNQFALGQKVMTKDGRAYMYVHASAAIGSKDWVGISEDFEAAPLTKGMADDGWFIGVADQTAIADNEFGWVCVQGTNITANVLSSCAPDVGLYTSGTAGALDDSSTSQTKIDGVVSVAVNAATAKAAVEVIMTHPRSATF